MIIAVLMVGLFFVTGSVDAARCYLYSDDIGYVCDADPPPPTFVIPDIPEDSLLNYTRYGRLADLANVYGEPSLGTLVRNVGDGYLWATVRSGPFEENGLTWYEINYGEYVLADDINIYPISQFQGVEVKQQPERPFGWIIVDYWYSDSPGAEPSENAIKLPRYTFFEVYDAVKDDEGWLWYNIGNGRWMKQTYVSLVDVTEKPEDVGEDEFWVEVDLYEQSFAAYEGRQMVYAGLVSSGLNRWATDEGLFQVWDRWEQTKMSGAEGRVDYYFIEDVPHTMFIDRVTEVALHGAYWHDRFGYKHSHGCVNMPPYAAEWVFEWSKDSPTDLWVYIHTSNPDHYFHRYDPLEDFAGA